MDSNDINFSEDWIILYFGIQFLVAGTGLLTILIYYYKTRLKRAQRLISLEGNELIWILLNVFIFSLFSIYFTDSPRMIKIGFLLIIKVILISIAGLFSWLIQRKIKSEKLEKEVCSSDPAIEKLLLTLSEIESRKKEDKSAKKRIVKVLPEYRIK